VGRATCLLGLLACLLGPADAAWVWVYEGNKHVVLPPGEGQPPWASYPDADGDGRPDPIITKVTLRVENTQGEAVARVRVGQTIQLVAVPELGALEEEPLTVRFHVTGPRGEAAIEPDPDIQRAVAVGVAPAVLRASCTIPAEPAADYAGEYQATLDLTLGKAVLPEASAPVAKFRVVAPREPLTEKVKRAVSKGMDRAAEDVNKAAQRVAKDVALALDFDRGTWPADVLYDVHERETWGLARQTTHGPPTPVPDETALAPKRAAAIQTVKPPLRSVLVVPVGIAQEPVAENAYPVGWLGLQGLRPSGVRGLGAIVPAKGRPFVLYRVVLKGKPGTPEPQVLLMAADGAQVLELTARVKPLARIRYPGRCSLRALKRLGEEVESEVQTILLAPTVDGIARVEFVLPVSGSATP
jgi:hypothetical protein